MKKAAFTLLAAVAGLCMSCNGPVAEKPENPFSQFTENPITVIWKGDVSEGIQSYQANVEVYSMNNRKDTGATLRETYRIAVKTINDRMYTRIDFPGDGAIAARSVLSDGTEMILFNPADGTVEYRIPIETTSSPLLKLFTQETGVSRINLSLIREEAKRLALDMTEEANGALVIDLPNNLFPANSNETVTRRRVSFDTTNETLIETETITISEDGTTVITSTTPVYDAQNGIPVKIGRVMVIDSQAPGLIEGFDPDTPVYNSWDDIPTMSQEEYEDWTDTDTLHEVPEVIFGNPADLSYTETVIELYQDMEINTVPDQLFKILLNNGGMK